MTASKVPPDVKAFIVGHLDSVEHLELLLLMNRSPDREWSAEEASHELRGDPLSAGRKLAELTAKGILERKDAGFRLPPGDSELKNLIDALGAAYRDHRYSVIELIFSKPIRALSTFSNAFRIKPTDPEDHDG